MPKLLLKNYVIYSMTSWKRGKKLQTNITTNPRINKEFILCAAIWVNDNQKHEQQPHNIEIGFVVCGRRHNNCYQTIKDLKGDVDIYFKSLNISENNYREYQGFITSLNRFVNRNEGWIIAKANNQIQFGLEATENGVDSIIISENLY